MEDGKRASSKRGGVHMYKKPKLVKVALPIGANQV